MHHVRRNADDRIRRLERAWSQGDEQAGAELVLELVRTGGLTLRRAAAMGEVVTRTLAVTDPVLAERLGFLFAGPRHEVRPKVPPPGLRGAEARMMVDGDERRWFHGCRSVRACPIGHEIGKPHVEWTDLELDMALREVVGPGPNGMLMVRGVWSSHEDGPTGETYLQCDTRVDRDGIPVATHWKGGPEEAEHCFAVWRPDQSLIDYV